MKMQKDRSVQLNECSRSCEVYFSLSKFTRIVFYFSALHINPTTISSVANNEKLNFISQKFNDSLSANDLDDYPNDNESDYSDYAYEDSTDQTTKSSTTTTTTVSTTTTTTTTTTRQTTTVAISIDDEAEKSSEDTKNTYYDYGDHDLYTDEEIDGTSTVEEPVLITTTRRITTTRYWKDRIPFYHRRPAIIWNVNVNDNDEVQKSRKHEQRYNSGSSLHYSSLILIIMFISRV